MPLSVLAIARYDSGTAGYSEGTLAGASRLCRRSLTLAMIAVLAALSGESVQKHVYLHGFRNKIVKNRKKDCV